MKVKYSNTKFEILILVISFLLIGLIGFIFFSNFNTFEILDEWFQKHESQNFDEIAVVIFIWFLCLFILFVYKHKTGVQQRKELSILSTELQENIDNKNKLFSILGHDLRSPFNSLIGFSDLLLKKFDLIDIKKQKEIISIINNTSKSTLVLLNNLLEWARVETNDLIIQKQNINLNNIINDAINLLESIAHNKNLTINNKLSESIIAFADENMISTVVRNLISNAIKYSHKNTSINITTKTFNNYIEICISDKGVGLTEEQINQLINNTAFSTPGTNNELGTGLGFKICKDFIEKNDGKINVNSIKGKGSDFSFTLPIPIRNKP